MLQPKLPAWLKRALFHSHGRSPDAVLEGIIHGLAMVIEQAPQCRTKRGLRDISQGYGKLLVQRAGQSRAAFDETGGIHMHEDDATSRVSKLN
ncbi:hypothetical protein [Novosphingobium sp. JCM 18896]|uniref:hypothetical protein n=1 Tax=Novosphingobium sp. JCM 18896 TaxID=2989731 RepID=UPI0022224F49|nr:hypothetical protein [Novosphingobium sp. JCM 18896]MCW1430870.1 hypothetical protein [Novosphingobium sp. JCM 18896]